MRFISPFLFLSFCFLFTTPSNAWANVLLNATEHSGYTTPENAFENHCEFDSSGHVSGYSATGWNGQSWTSSKNFSFQISESELKKMKTAIEDSRSGPFQNTRAQCDAGSVNLVAKTDGDSQNISITETPDCAPGVINKNPAVQSLQAWVGSFCKIRI